MKHLNLFETESAYNSYISGSKNFPDVSYVMDIEKVFYSPFIDTTPNGVYAVSATGELIDYNSADATALGVALVAGEHKFMIAKRTAADTGTKTLYWGRYLYGKDVTGITNISTGNGYIGEGETYNPNFTTWSSGPVMDFNGKANTAAIIAAYAEHGVSAETRDMCSVLNIFNQEEQTFFGRSADWYIPACGQLALMYLNKNEINNALAKIGGEVISSAAHWSSTQSDAGGGWAVVFNVGYVDKIVKNNNLNRVRFIRDI